MWNSVSKLPREAARLLKTSWSARGEQEHILFSDTQRHNFTDTINNVILENRFVGSLVDAIAEADTESVPTVNYEHTGGGLAIGLGGGLLLRADGVTRWTKSWKPSGWENHKVEVLKHPSTQEIMSFEEFFALLRELRNKVIDRVIDVDDVFYILMGKDNPNKRHGWGMGTLGALAATGAGVAYALHRGVRKKAKRPKNKEFYIHVTRYNETHREQIDDDIYDMFEGNSYIQMTDAIFQDRVKQYLRRRRQQGGQGRLAALGNGVRRYLGRGQ
jgi:hypothetical protein